MTKKRMNGLILLLFFILYIACGFITFSSCKAYTITNFTTPSQSIISLVQNNLTDESDNSFENMDLLVNDGIIQPLNSFGYPFAFAIFDKNGNVVSTGSQTIDFNDEFIPIDDYITDDMVAQIKTTFKKLPSCGIIKMKYNKIDGKTVPTTVTIGDVNTKTTLDLQFNKSVSKEYTAYTTESMYFENVDEQEFEYIYMDCNSILNSNKYDIKYYKQILKQVVEPLEDSDIKKIKNGNNSGTAYYGQEEVDFDCIFDFQGENYCFKAIVKYSPNYNTLVSSQFEYEIINQSIIFAIVFVISIVLLNKIYAKNSRLNDARQAFTCACAHELKTPLAVIQNQCECIIENVAPEKNDKYINAIYSESLRMNKLVATLLQYNRLANATKIEKTPCQIENIIQNEIEKYSSLMQCKNIELLVDVKPYKKINLNEKLISLVVDNFLSNAIKHTVGKITIAGKEENGRYIVTVANEGENIKKEYEKNLWDIFYRTDEARTQNDDNSTGMGLAICKKILQLHKYKFGFNNLKKGVEFYFIIK